MISHSKTKFTEKPHYSDKIIVSIVTFISIAYMILLIVELYIQPTISNVSWQVILDTSVCIIFLFEFFYFMFRTKRKKEFFKHNIIDFLASIPFMLFFVLNPYVTLLNIFKILRGIKSLVKIYEFMARKTISMLGQIFFLFVTIVVYFALVIVTIERNINAGLATFHDGVWWAISTVTSVGYGDVTPITYFGKFAAVFLMVFGIGISSALGALFVSWIMKASQTKIIDQENKIQKREKEISQTENQISHMEDNILKKLDNIEEEVRELQENKRK
ncbi:ion transporter [Candidatus Woesearchaeota archaeon]|nr:ion transporter [Candidatus Woesearchaeota archaeon]